jgi:hypothetical protein
MVSIQLQQAAAWIATIGFAGMAGLQLLLALGAPLGHLAWGGQAAQLPPNLRLASLGAGAIFLVGAICVLERAQIIQVLAWPRLAGVMVWLLAALFALSTLGNLLSSSKLEQRMMTPVAFILCAACVIVALGPARAGSF